MVRLQWKVFLMGMLISSLLAGCILKPKDEKKVKSANPELDELTSIYESFDAETFDDVPSDQFAKGLKWYPDAEQRPASPLLEQSPLEELRTQPATPNEHITHKPFIVTVYESDSPQTITFYYSLDKTQGDNWKELYDVSSVTAKKVSFLMDYQDHKLFGFDYYLLPELLKLEIIWSDENIAEVFIDPLVQKSQVNVKGVKNLGIVTKGIDENRQLLIKNTSALEFQAKVLYMDERLGEEAEKRILVPVNSSRLVQLPRFMKIEKMLIEASSKSISEEISPDSLFTEKDDIACLLLGFSNDQVKITPKKAPDFSSCYEQGKTYEDWLIEKMPELVESDAASAEPEVPDFSQP
ncbi:MAG: hypothetical protein OXE99_13745 [Cellvibrionales bacterium]|nr:hypothetical protein [Cellvibrionales bacterium]